MEVEELVKIATYTLNLVKAQYEIPKTIVYEDEDFLQIAWLVWQKTLERLPNIDNVKAYFITALKNTYAKLIRQELKLTSLDELWYIDENGNEVHNSECQESLIVLPNCEEFRQKSETKYCIKVKRRAFSLPVKREVNDEKIP
ncbi:MAG: hypothetical protein QXY76_03270 [Nitrososphaeria archaeon]